MAAGESTEVTHPLRNRVTPFGEIVAVAARGTLMGNRGTLHNARQEIVRDWQMRRWIACRLEFRGRRRQVMTPGSYTELFFLDEAAALADGHRPCAECRHADYVAFQNGWRVAFPDAARPTADSMDAVLHAERRVRAYVKRTHQMELASLPDGTYVALDRKPWLVQGNALVQWSAGSYLERRRRPEGGEVAVLTPPSIVAVLRTGYRPGLHPTVSRFLTSNSPPVDRRSALD